MKASISSNDYSCRLGAVMFVVSIHFPMLKIVFIQLALNTKTSTRPFNEHSNNIIIKSVKWFLIRGFWNFQPTRTHYCSNSVKFHLINIPVMFGSNQRSGFIEEDWNVKNFQTTTDA